MLRMINYRLLSVSVVFLAAAQPAAAQQSVVSVCAGVSLPRSVITDIVGPIATGIAGPVEDTVNPLLGVVDALLPGLLPQPLNVNVSGLLADAADGDPITLSVLDDQGQVVGPSDDCIATSDGVTLEDEGGIAIGGNMISGLGANGEASSADDIDAIAIGNGASTEAGATGAIALGQGASVAAGAAGAVAIGQGAEAMTDNSIALGAGSVADDDLSAAAYNPGTGSLPGAAAAGEVSVGDEGAERRITNVAAGSADTDAANVGQLRALDEKFTDLAGWNLRYDSADKDIATLEGADGTLITNLRPGLVAETSTDAINGSQLHATNVALAELSDRAVQYDVDGDGNRTNSVSLVGGDTAQPVRVRNVARGVADTDAVNVGQLEEYADSVGETTYIRSREYTDAVVGEVRNEARQAAAIGLAAASLRFDARPGKISVGASGGFWRGQGAMAFGMGYTNATGRMRANATAATAGGAWGGSAGVSLTLN